MVNMTAEQYQYRYKSRGVLPALPIPQPGMPAVHSQTVLNSFGMNVQPWNSNNYQNYAKVEAYLVDLGVRLIRSKVVADPSKSDAVNIANASNVFMHNMCVNHGMKWHATLGEYDPNIGRGDLAAGLAHYRADQVAMVPVLEAYADDFEGWGNFNEPNGIRLGALNNLWPQFCLDQQQWMWAVRQARLGTMAQILVCSPSMHDNPPGGNTQLAIDYAQLAPLAPYMDRGDMHRYPSGQVPSNGIDQRTTWFTNAVGLSKLPIDISEGGYNTTPLVWAARVTPNVQGSYAPRWLLEHLIRGNKAFWFDLLCQYDATQSNNQDWYGMIAAPTPNDNDLTPLKAFTTMKRFLAFFEDGTAPYTPTAANLKITGDVTIKSYLTQKRDGTYRLALWRDVKLWNKATHAEIPAAFTATKNAILTFGSSTPVTRYTPAVGTSGTVTLGSVHTIPVAGDAMVLTF